MTNVTQNESGTCIIANVSFNSNLDDYFIIQYGELPLPYHITLMYDRNMTKYPEQEVMDSLSSIIGLEVGVQEMICLPDNQAGAGYGVLALKMENNIRLQIVQKWLKSAGYRHSFDEWLPHVTVRYKIPVACNADIANVGNFLDDINPKLKERKLVATITSVDIEPITK